MLRRQLWSVPARMIIQKEASKTQGNVSVLRRRRDLMMICQLVLGETQLGVVKAPLLARAQVTLKQRVTVETQLGLSNKQLKKKTLRRAQGQ